MTTSINPLLADQYRIPFHLIRPEEVGPGIGAALEEARREVDAIVAQEEDPTWANTMERLDRTTERLARRIAPAAHLMTVAESPPLREAYNAVLPDITAFWSSLPLNEGLWLRIRSLSGTDGVRDLSDIQRRHLEKTVREFKRAGADLAPEAKERLKDIRVELSQLEQAFSENVLDATAEYEYHVTDESRLAGVPPAPRRRFRARAEEQGLEGWLLTLDYPSVEPILKHCDDRDLRREIQVAYATRCREGKHDNRATIARILRLRDEMAHLLGYDNFPDYKLEERMARSGAKAAEFEADLVERTRPYWMRDVEALRAKAEELGLDELEPWDVAYIMEKLRRERFDIDDEVLRPYFPLERVLEGLFEIVRRVFHFTIRERQIEEVWHPDVRFYEIFDENEVLVGSFYTDWFPRKEKRQGAWMNDFITGGPRDDGFAPHLGVVCGNFTPPHDDTPSLLTHREVETTFHEFGHLLHHCTSRVEIPARAGINVAWDWVELPSQFMENWTWEREALTLFARHYETGEPLPDDIFQRMVAARRFMGGWVQMRQLSFGTVDLFLHGEVAPELRHEAGADPDPHTDREQGERVMERVRERFLEFAPSETFAELHALTSFTHLFSGGYAAGYYSYLWSEVLDADAFTRFQEEGIFNPETGRAYVEAILSRGDSADPEALFHEFMGRPPEVGALIARNLGPAPAS